MSLTIPPEKFTIYNDLQTKRLCIVVDIEGLDYLTSNTIGRKIRYGDPIFYGDPGLVYDGQIPIGAAPGERGQKNLLSLDGGSLTISQRLEPEQGRAAISTISMSFIDLDGYMTRAITPGLIIDEILGRAVKVWIGYVQNNFPEDYYVIWRGRISQLNPEPGRITMQFSDANMGKRTTIFYQGKTKLAGAITALSTTINVTSNTDFILAKGVASLRFFIFKVILFPSAVTWNRFHTLSPKSYCMRAPT